MLVVCDRGVAVVIACLERQAVYRLSRQAKQLERRFGEHAQAGPEKNAPSHDVGGVFCRHDAGKLIGALVLVGLLLLSSACRARSGSGEIVRQPPVAPAVRVAEPYALNLKPRAVASESVCAVEPDRCPYLDLVASEGLGIGSSGEAPQILLTGALAGAPAVSRHSDSLMSASSRVVAQAESKILDLPGRPRGAPEASRPQRAEQPSKHREVEAHLTVDVEQVTAAVLKVRRQVRALSGEISSEVYEDTQTQYGAALSIRVPVEKTSELLTQLATLGQVRSRKVETKDISRKLLDAELLLRNLRLAVKRYEHLLGQAKEVVDIAGIEASLARLRTQIERVEGDLRWLLDLGARSTIYLKLTSERHKQYAKPPAAKLWPGARGVALFDLGSAASPRAFSGAGLSYLLSRKFGFDMSVLRSLQGEPMSLFMASMGGEVYSDYLGGGERRFLNPFIGFRGAYLQHAGLHEGALGATLGLELVRTEHLLVDLQARGYAAFASRLGLHGLIEPGLGLSAAF